MTTRTEAPALGEFLRARRARVRPEAHGLPAGERRTPGLRREEVATLAGVSTDYYVRLEQGRERNPSPQVLDALASVLLLDDEAGAYLLGLSAAGASRPRPPQREAAEGLVALMDAWSGTPALVYDRYMHLLATNALGAALFSWLDGDADLLRGIFTNPAARTFYIDWPRIAEGCVAALRAENPDPADPVLADLVARLSADSADFVALWARHDVRAKTAEIKHLHHRDVGPLALRFENLTVADAPGQHLVVYHAEPGSPEERALARLAAPLEQAPEGVQQGHPAGRSLA